MNSTSPRVSVVIAVHNGEDYLAEAIQSIVDQDHGALEVIVVDNASTDGTARVARGFEAVQYFFLEQKGMVDALNHGIEQSQGEFLGFLDADDLWVTDKLLRQLAAFTADPELDLVFSQISEFASPELDDSTRKGLKVREGALTARFRGTMLIRKSSLLAAGPFDNTTEYGDFMEWLSRPVVKSFRSLMLQEVLMLRRLHGNNMGYQNPTQNRLQYARVLKRVIDRRRSKEKA